MENGADLPSENPYMPNNGVNPDSPRSVRNLLILFITSDICLCLHLNHIVAHS